MITSGAANALTRGSGQPPLQMVTNHPRLISSCRERSMGDWNSATTTFTRRNLLFITGAAAGVGGSGGTGQAQATPAPSRIEPVTIKRRGVGLRGYDRGRAFAGFTLFAPLPSSNRTVYLIDMEGTVAHTWRVRYPAGQSGYLTERGTLFYNGQIPNESHVGHAPYKGGAALEMTWDGRILWEVRHPDHNHDGIRLRNGNVMLICQKPLSQEITAKIQGWQTAELCHQRRAASPSLDRRGDRDSASSYLAGC